MYINYLQIKKGLEQASALLEENIEALNRLNYFPVADKDTGTNMTSSARKALEHLNRVSDAGTPKSVLRAYSDGLLEYGRGNSGTILAMFFDGFWASLPEGERINGTDLARALDCAAESACMSVENVKDGTMLSVAKDAASAGLSFASLSSDPVLLWTRICDEAASSLKTTRLRNPKLKAAGVVDSGAYGLCLIFNGLLSGISHGASLYDYSFVNAPENLPESDELLQFPYCTELLLAKKNTSTAAELADRCRPYGDCLLCVENEEKIKLHIHTDNPQKIKEIAEDFGDTLSEKVEDMRNGKGAA